MTPTLIDPALEGSTALVAASEPIQALDLRQMPHELGCVVLDPAVSAADAMSLLDQRTPSHALLDLGLRDGGFLPVAEMLAAHGVPFMVMTTGGECRAIEGEPLLRGALRLIEPYRPAESVPRASELRRARAAGTKGQARVEVPACEAGNPDAPGASPPRSRPRRRAMGAGWLAGTTVVLVMTLAGMATAAQPAAAPSTSGSAAPQPRHSEAFGSYLSVPEQENVMFHDGLDADELIGSTVVSPNGTRLATVADLLVEADGRVRQAVIDPGSALGAGSRHVVVPIERLRRTEAGSGVLSLDITDAALRAMPTYRQRDNRWEPIP